MKWYICDRRGNKDEQTFADPWIACSVADVLRYPYVFGVSDSRPGVIAEVLIIPWWL